MTRPRVNPFSATWSIFSWGSDMNGMVERQKVADMLLDLRNNISGDVQGKSDCDWTVMSVLDLIDGSLGELKEL